MRTLLLLILLVFVSTYGYCQDAQAFSDKGYDYLYTNKDSSYYYFEKAIVGFKESKDIDSELATYFGLLYANGYHYDLKGYKKNVSKFERLIYTKAKYTSDYFVYFKDRLYLEKINYYFKLGDTRLAQVYIDSLNSFQDLRQEKERDVDYYDTHLRAGLYQGSIYKNQNKLNLALDKYKQLESFTIKHQDSLYDFKNSSLSIKRLKAKAYASLGEIDRAILTQINALELIENDPSYSNSELDLELDLTANLISSNELGEARELLKLLKDKNIKKPNFKIRLLDQEIALSRVENKTAQNHTYHEEKIKALKSYREIDEHPDLINAYINYASDIVYWGDYSSALRYLNQASRLFSQTPIKQQTFAYSKIKLSLAEGYLQAYKLQDFTENSAADILSKSQDIIDALDELQPQFESKLDKQYLINSAYPALQTAFVLLYDLYKTLDNPEYLNKAFEISEKSKAIELRAIRQAGIAQSTNNVDPEIVETENLFNYIINQLEKDVFIATDDVQELQEKLVNQKEAYGDFISNLRLTEPEYYNLRYKNNVLNLPETVSYLRDNTVTLSFFQIQERMFVLKISNAKSEILELSYTKEIQQKLREYYTSLSNYSVSKEDQTAVLGQEIYQHFIAPIFPKTIPESVTIIPDGLLHYIPFEALRDNDEYLLNRTIISYKPSVSFQQGLSMDTPLKTTFIGFAPSFGAKNPLNLGSLAYNQEEIELANRYYKGVQYSGSEGSLERFRESVKENLSLQNQPIYHFATHAVTNDSLPEYSYLAFSSNSSKSDFLLYAKDLYTEKLNAAMVVLSACETGLGKIENGQGMQSLAQGFNYAGASSLVYSKWNVSDRYTANLIGLFYKYLSQGLPKDKALQQAKTEYLNTVDDPSLKHPFYWAGFVFSGDSVPLQSKSRNLKWLWLLGVILGVGIIGRLIRRKISR